MYLFTLLPMKYLILLLPTPDKKAVRKGSILAGFNISFKLLYLQNAYAKTMSN